MKLSFRTLSTEPEIVTIEDGFNNSIDIPKRGYFNVSEELEISTILMQADMKIGFSAIKLKSVATFLSLRLDTKITEKDLIDNCPSMQLINAIYDFLDGERRKWVEPSLLLECHGELAYEIARKTAEEIGDGAVVASREDLRLQKIYFIYKSIDDVPSSYEYKPEDVFGVGK